MLENLSIVLCIVSAAPLTYFIDNLGTVDMSESQLSFWLFCGVLGVATAGFALLRAMVVKNG